MTALLEASQPVPAVAPPMMSEAAQHTSFSTVRYAQCWEDADVLLAGLDVQPGDACLSIASAGDNTLALLTRRPGRVVALDLNPAQLACLSLRVGAYRALEYEELLELMGARDSRRRSALYARCRPALDASARAFWDARPIAIARGFGRAGRFERYFTLFRRWVLPLTHSSTHVARLLEGNSTVVGRQRFYDTVWDNRRWRWLFHFFFSRAVMSRLGRSPGQFSHVEGNVADQLQARARRACIALDPADNPYLQWILTGRHTTALPLALRAEHFETIRDNLDRLTWHEASLEAYLSAQPAGTFARFNLSDVFEYVSPSHYHRLLALLHHTGQRGGRLAYWNLFVDRQRPGHLSERLRPLSALATQLHTQDRAFFYKRFVLEELC